MSDENREFTGEIDQDQLNAELEPDLEGDQEGAIGEEVDVPQIQQPAPSTPPPIPPSEDVLPPPVVLEEMVGEEGDQLDPKTFQDVTLLHLRGLRDLLGDVTKAANKQVRTATNVRDHVVTLQSSHQELVAAVNEARSAANQAANNAASVVDSVNNVITPFDDVPKTTGGTSWRHITFLILAVAMVAGLVLMWTSVAELTKEVRNLGEDTPQVTAPAVAAPTPREEVPKTPEPLDSFDEEAAPQAPEQSSAQADESSATDENCMQACKVEQSAFQSEGTDLDTICQNICNN